MWDDAHSYYLACFVFAPLLFGILGLCIPLSQASRKKFYPIWALFSSIFVFLYTIVFWKNILVGVCGESALSAFQLVEIQDWFPMIGVKFALGMDAISFFLILLTTFLLPFVILSSFRSVSDRVCEYYLCVLALESAILGAFLAIDLFLFYIFWEAMLIPMYLLIGIWGGKDRIFAATKFFLFTLIGSLFMLVAIFYLAHLHHVQFGFYSLLFTNLIRLQIPFHGFWSPQSLLFLGFLIAFLVKVPLFPLHTWLPFAHVEAPTGGSVILAAILLKMGGYGLLRFALPLFPSAAIEFQMVILTLSAIAIVYGAWVAMAQTDMKKLVAYSSVSHMGYVTLGLFSFDLHGMTGAFYQMLNHGMSTGALFLLVGMLYERKHTRELSAMGGLAKVMPGFAIILLIVAFSSIALPGTNGFVGEFLILLGTWPKTPLLTAISALGVILGPVYMLGLLQKVLFGPLREENRTGLGDLTLREWCVLVPLVVVIVGMGLYPNLFFDAMVPSLEKILDPILAKMHSGALG